jgi:hypothetical protein
MDSSVNPEPDIRPGLPVQAARNAYYRGERLVHGEALLDARERAVDALPDLLLNHLGHQAAVKGTVNVSAATLHMLVEEVRHLRGIAEQHLVLLEAAADQEAQRYDYELRYPIVYLADDAYIAWAGGSDAPVGWVMTEAQALERGYTRKRLDAAPGPDTRGYFYNRSGPWEKPLTVAAMLEAFASPEAHAAFRLTPDKVMTYTTSESVQDPDTREWVSGPTYWVPWHPDETPETLPEDWKDRY